MLKINEIFFSIQGESSWVGNPTTFVRTSGCPLRCTYCDTTYAYYEGYEMALDEIIAKVQQNSSKYVCITGGEPLAQKEVLSLMTQLCDLGFKVSLETSGQISCQSVDPRVKKIIDVKTPDSGAANSFCNENLLFADQNTEFKFVICSERDFDWSEDFSEKNNLFAKSNVLYSPSYNKVDQRWLAESLLKNRSQARLQIQLHKVIWSDVRGV